MNEQQYNLQFEKLCNTLQLGEIVGLPKRVSGGLLHKMYLVETTRGKYAIKALNPQIMIRPMAVQNFTNSEQIVNVATKNIHAIPAKKFNSTSIQEMDNQFYLVFDWIEGKSLKPSEVRKVHCEKIGSILADLHKVDFSELCISNNRSDNAQLTDWNYYLYKGQEDNLEWAGIMLEIIDKLYEWNIKANEASKILASNMVISHGDMDLKNVLWNQYSPVIIDWEAAGYVNPMQELIETAIYWSENEAGIIEKDRFLAFINAYKKRSGALQADWKTVLSNGFLGKLGWLEYSLKRSLRIECTDEIEQKIGTNHAIGTINVLRRYADTVSELERWLNNEI